MELYLDLRDQTIHDEQLYTHVSLINEAADNHKIFQSQKNLQSYVKEINASLNHGKKKWNGIQLLIVALPQCSHEVLEQHAEKWLCLCTSVISSKVSWPMKKDTCTALTLMFTKMSPLPQVLRSITLRHALNLIPYLLTADDEWKNDALQCLYNYGVIFPQHLVSFKKDIEKLMIFYLDTPIGKSLAGASLCSRVYGSIPVTGGSGNKSSIRGSKVSQIISLSHDICDMIFHNVIEKQSYEKDDEETSSLKLPLPSNNNGSEENIIINVTRLINSFTLIYEQFAVASSDNNMITFKPAQLLSLFLRVLQVEVKPLINHKGQEHLILALLMPSLHLRALNTLDLLLSRPSIAYALDEYWGIIASQIVQTLKTSKQRVGPQSSGGSHDSGLRIRAAAYNAMNSLIKISSGSVSASVDLVSVVLTDVTPQKESVTLRNSLGNDLKAIAVKTKNKKRKRKLVSTVQEEHKVLSKSTFNNDQMSATVTAALQLIESICLHCVDSPPAAMKDLYFGLKNIAEIILLPWTRLGENVYCEGSVRSLLIRSLVSLCVQPRFYCIPSYLHIISILEAGLRDSSRQVKEACQNGIHTISFIMANPVISDSATMHSFTSSEVQQHMEVNGEIQQTSSDDEIMSDQEEDIANHDQSQELEQSIINTEDDAATETMLEECDPAADDDDDVTETMSRENDNGYGDNSLNNDKFLLNNLSTIEEEEESDADSESEPEEVVSLPPVKKSKVESPKNSKKQDHNVSIEEMLASFVDADPD